MKSKYTFAQKFMAFFMMLGLLILPIGAIQAQTRDLVQEENKGFAQKRIALIIGNGNYTSARKLDNPVNDATDMTATLKALGFEVISGTDLNLRNMKAKVREFGNKLRASKGVGLFYYAGHGVQVRGSNYLIPVNAEIPQEDEVEFAALNLNFVMQKMATANNGLNIVILDACRNNPFARGWSRSVDDGGLAQVSAPTGTFIAYATAPNMTASDGTGRNGLYTAELLKYLKKPGLSIEQAFKQVTIAVNRTSGGKQLPWISSSLTGEFYFNADGKEVVAKTPVNSTPTTNNRTASATEKASWELVKDSDDISDLELYLNEFPNGVYSTAARMKIAKIQKDAWDLVKDSEDPKKIQGFIDRYPKSENASLARIILKQLADKKAEQLAEKKANAPKPGTVKTNAMGMEFVYIPAGEFMMGSSESDVDIAFADFRQYKKDAKREWFSRETPQRKITIKDGFWMGKYEVTQEQYEQVMGRNPSNFKNKCGAKCPVEKVSWNDAKEFIRKLNSRNDGFTYSLPTEAEWEYAARAGTTTAFAVGNSLNSTQANFNGNYPYGGASKGKFLGKTTPVGSYQPNNWGLYDMHGNVWEWCENIYQDNYNNLPTGGSANVSRGDSDKRVVRGGSWELIGFNLRSANRVGISPSVRNYSFGFRVVARPSAL